MNSTTTLQADLLRVAHMLADVARAATLPHFRSATLLADNKKAAGFDPVTEADRAAEQAMRAVLAAERPDDAIRGEEFGATPGTSGLTWVLDPIDGTRGFLSGTPTWGVLIAVADVTGPVLGIVDQPYIAERFVGGFGRASLTGPLGMSDLRTRPARPLAQSILFSTFPEIGTPAERQAFEALAEQVRLTRFGMDCYAYALLAAGQIDLVVEAGLQDYDVMAPIALITAAGGLVTNWTGGSAAEGGRVIAAANAQVHAEALAILSSQAD